MKQFLIMLTAMLAGCSSVPQTDYFLTDAQQKAQIDARHKASHFGPQEVHNIVWDGGEDCDVPQYRYSFIERNIGRKLTDAEKKALIDSYEATVRKDK